MNYLSSKQQLVVVADDGRARLFVVNPDTDDLEEIESLVNPEARLHTRELQADRPGRSFDRVGGGRHALVGGTEPQQHMAEMFAGTIMDRLRQLTADGKFRGVALVAPPATLGLLRQKLTPGLKQLVSCEIGRDLTTSSASEIEDRVTRELRGH